MRNTPTPGSRPSSGRRRGRGWRGDDRGPIRSRILPARRASDVRLPEVGEDSAAAEAYPCRDGQGPSWPPSSMPHRDARASTRSARGVGRAGVVASPTTLANALGLLGVSAPNRCRSGWPALLGLRLRRASRRRGWALRRPSRRGPSARAAGPGSSWAGSARLSTSGQAAARTGRVLRGPMVSGLSPRRRSVCGSRRPGHRPSRPPPPRPPPSDPGDFAEPDADLNSPNVSTSGTLQPAPAATRGRRQAHRDRSFADRYSRGAGSARSRPADGRTRRRPSASPRRAGAPGRTAGPGRTGTTATRGGSAAAPPAGWSTDRSATPGGAR